MTTTNITKEEISRRAYEIWEKAGRPTGCEAKHWAEAERQLRAERTPVTVKLSAPAPQPAVVTTPKPAPVAPKPSPVIVPVYSTPATTVASAAPKPAELKKPAGKGKKRAF